MVTLHDYNLSRSKALIPSGSFAHISERCNEFQDSILTLRKADLLKLRVLQLKAKKGSE